MDTGSSKRWSTHPCLATPITRTWADRASEIDRGNDSQQPQQSWQLRQQPQRQSTPDSPSSLQNIPLGSKRKEIKSVKGVLNIAMNTPLNGSSRSRPSSTPGSPLAEPRVHILGQQPQNQPQQPQQQQQQQQQQPSSFGTDESHQLNGYNSAAARSAKVKSDLLMGLNSPTIRSDRPPSGTMKGPSEAGQQQGGNSLRLNSLSGYDMNQLGANLYGQSSLSGNIISGPPPGLGISSMGSVPNSSNNSPRLMSSVVDRNLENGQGASYLPNSKPVDMMNSDFFAPGQPNSLMMNSNWNILNGNHADNQTLVNGTSQDSTHGGKYSDQMGHNDPNKPGANPVDNTGTSAPQSGTDSSTLSGTAGSVEDLELQVINARMETQMLESQLNAVIKRNRRKLYA
ncbi:hypothetical protein B0O80DRAFT_261432 [Mortierella sp. GBAus27b]|nr:hypothetical protein B0O80DRAFT_261432 [Mortierella sp. GBAus27b]